MGKNLYVDDLVTGSDARSKGYGKVLMIDCAILPVNQAVRTCTWIPVRSGTGRTASIFGKEWT